MKIFFCLFGGPFGVQRSGVFLFEVSFFISEMLTFFYCAGWFSDDVIWFAAKNW